MFDDVHADLKAFAEEYPQFADPMNRVLIEVGRSIRLLQSATPETDDLGGMFANGAITALVSARQEIHTHLIESAVGIADAKRNRRRLATVRKRGPVTLAD